MPRSLTSSAFVLGFTSLLTQIVVARELLTSFLGNEISIAIVLLVWLALVALGSALFARLLVREGRARSAVPWLQSATAAVLVPAVWIAQAGGGVGRFPGQVVGPATMLVLAAATLALPCLLFGGVFAALCRTAEGGQTRDAVTRIYALEAAGAVAAGLLFHFVFAERVGSAQSVLVAAAANVAVAGWAWRDSGAGARAPAVWSVGLAGIAAALLCPWGHFGLDRPGLARRWRGMNVVAETNSRYGNIAVVGAGPMAVYQAGLPAFTTEDTQASEIAVHPALLIHPHPRRVLMLSGGLGGGMAEVLKHPVERVDYVEIDQALVGLARRTLPPDVTAPLDDPRVHIHYRDGRAFVKSTDERYAVVLVLAPDPATTALSRFYTREFFQEVRHVLAPDGLICVGLTAAQAKLSGPRQYLHASVYRALEDVFPAVLAVPGEYTQYIAAPSRAALTADPAVLAARLKARGIATSFVNDAWLQFALGPLPREVLLSSLEEAADAPPNRDTRPIAAHHWLRLWLAEMAPSWAPLLEAAPRAAPAAWLLIPLSLFAALVLRRHPRLPAGAAVVCVTGTGFLEMGAQLALVIAYQAVVGRLYHQIGVLMALFMMGLATGAMAAGRLADRFPARWLLVAVSVQALSAAGLPLLFVVGTSPQVTNVVFGVAAAWMGFLGGLNFPLAVALASPNGSQTPRVAARLYAADLSGAALGAVLIGAVAIPATGVQASCRMLAAVLLAALAPLAVSVLRPRG